MIGTPRVNDKIAFQILEISSNFTPEISEFKAGTIVEFDKDTNEISIELYNNKYNQVLNRPSKFSVILDETDKEYIDEQSDELSRTSQESENILKVDWRNLMNLKIIPNETEMAKQEKFATEQPTHMNLHV